MPTAIRKIAAIILEVLAKETEQKYKLVEDEYIKTIDAIKKTVSIRQSKTT